MEGGGRRGIAARDKGFLPPEVRISMEFPKPTLLPILL